MDVRSQVAMVFHLDKCIGCHTCSIACKNIWTDRKGTEYMWWNNVETKPGTGYPTLWEDQERYRGGWDKRRGKLKLKLQGRGRALGNIFANPHLPTVDDYRRTKAFLEKQRWVSGVEEKGFSPEQSVLVVTYPEKTLYLASRLGREPRYKLLEFDRARILMEYRP